MHFLLVLFHLRFLTEKGSEYKPFKTGLLQRFSVMKYQIFDKNLISYQDASHSGTIILLFTA